MRYNVSKLKDNVCVFGKQIVYFALYGEYAACAKRGNVRFEMNKYVSGEGNLLMVFYGEEGADFKRGYEKE